MLAELIVVEQRYRGPPGARGDWRRGMGTSSVPRCCGLWVHADQPRYIHTERAGESRYSSARTCRLPFSVRDKAFGVIRCPAAAERSANSL
jgi:hypothetical protein